MAELSLLSDITIQGQDLVAVYRALDQFTEPADLRALALQIGFCHPNKDIPDSLSETLTFLVKLGMVEKLKGEKRAQERVQLAEGHRAPLNHDYQLAVIAGIRDFDRSSDRGPHGPWRILIQAVKTPALSQQMSFTIDQATEVVRNSKLQRADDWSKGHLRDLVFRVYGQLGVGVYENRQLTLMPRLPLLRRLIALYVQTQAQEGVLGLRGLVTFIDEHYFACLVDGQPHPGLQGAVKYLENRKELVLIEGSDAANKVRIGTAEYARFEWKGSAS